MTEEKEEHFGWTATWFMATLNLIRMKNQIIKSVGGFYFERTRDQNLPEPTFHLLPAYPQNTEGSLLVCEAISSPQRGGKLLSKNCGFAKPFQMHAWKQTWRRMEKWVISFSTEPTGGWRLSRALSLCWVDLVCTHCFVCPGPYFLNISLHAASEMLKFRQLNLGCHLTVARWPSEAI